MKPVSGTCRLCGRKVEGIPVLPGKFDDMIWNKNRTRVHWFRAPRRKSVTEQLSPVNGHESVEPQSEVEAIPSGLAVGLLGTVAGIGFGVPIRALPDLPA